MRTSAVHYATPEISPQKLNNNNKLPLKCHLTKVCRHKIRQIKGLHIENYKTLTTEIKDGK